jgi:hypothetical protein
MYRRLCLGCVHLMWCIYSASSQDAHFDSVNIFRLCLDLISVPLNTHTHTFLLYLYISVSISISLYLSLYICIYLYLSLYICIYLYFSLVYLLLEEVVCSSHFCICASLVSSPGNAICRKEPCVLRFFVLFFRR